LVQVFLVQVPTVYLVVAESEEDAAQKVAVLNHESVGADVWVRSVSGEPLVAVAGGDPQPTQRQTARRPNRAA